MATKMLDASNLESTVTENSIVVLDFWAPWCAPCRRFAPVFEAASEQHTDVVFGKVNTQDHPNVAAAYQIQSIPTLMVFRDQILLYREAGALPGPMFEELLAKVKELDMDDIRRQIAEGQA